MTTERVIVEQRQGIRFRPALVFETTPPKTAEERFRLCVAGTVLFDVIGDNRFCGFDKNCFFRGAMYGNQDVLGSPTSQPTIGETVADELNRIVVTEEASPARLRSTIELRQRLARSVAGELLTGELLSGADATIAYVAAPTPPRGDRSESYFWLNGGGAGEYRITVYDNEREVFEMRAGSVETFIQFCPPRTAFGTYDHSHPDVTLCLAKCTDDQKKAIRQILTDAAVANGLQRALNDAKMHESLVPAPHQLPPFPSFDEFCSLPQDERERRTNATRHVLNDLIALYSLLYHSNQSGLTTEYDRGLVDRAESWLDEISLLSLSSSRGLGAELCKMAVEHVETCGGSTDEEQLEAGYTAMIVNTLRRVHSGVIWPQGMSSYTDGKLDEHQSTLNSWQCLSYLCKNPRSVVDINATAEVRAICRYAVMHLGMDLRSLSWRLLALSQDFPGQTNTTQCNDAARVLIVYDVLLPFFRSRSAMVDSSLLKTSHEAIIAALNQWVGGDVDLAKYLE